MKALLSAQREHLLKELAAHLEPGFFETWCSTLDLDELAPNIFQVRCPSRYWMDVVEPKLRPALSRVIESLTGTLPQVTFTIDEQPRQDLEPPRPIVVAPAKKPDVVFSGVRLQEQYTFDTFIEGPTNRFAKAAGMHVAQEPFEHNLFIHGKSGVGKTHLLHAVCHLALKHRPDLKIAYLPCEAFISDFVTAMKSNATEEFRRRYKNIDFLVIDDIDMLADKDATQNEFFHLFNHLTMNKKQLVLSSDAPPRSIQTFKERLFSRLESGLVAEIAPPNVEMRMAIIEAKAERKGKRIPEEVARFIAETIVDNVRELEGAVVKVIAMASLTERAVDLDLAREALKHRIEAPRQIFGVDDVCRLVAGRYGVEPKELLQRSRSPRVTLAKQMALTLCYSSLRYTIRELAKLFGVSAHNSVAYAIKKTRQAMQRDPALRRDYEQLLHQTEQLMKMFPTAG
jgi:chromosomal replication initiator protein